MTKWQRRTEFMITSGVVKIRSLFNVARIECPKG
jgi:hypothetical protein